ncbi:MAG: divalent-cation tolerance protein CutA [Betaproteobacteria bacterium]|nr:divalent-cation tolerance protein CutA [Betaproteobacteria bacterium]
MAVDNRDIIIVLTNLPDRATATRLAALLVERRHAACVNILAECTSVYRWEGRVKTAIEVPMLIKTSRSAYSRLEEEILANHPYELPEIVSVPLGAGLPAYLDWVAAESVVE